MLHIVSQGKPMTRGELAYKIAERYSRFFAIITERETTTDPNWRVCANGVNFDSLVLVSISMSRVNPGELRSNYSVDLATISISSWCLAHKLNHLYRSFVLLALVFYVIH